MNITKQLTAVALLCCGLGVPPAHGATLTVNDGTAESSYVPFHFYYLDNASCRTQIIYPASQLAGMTGSAIREVQFYLNDEGYTGDWSASDMRVTFGETAQETFTLTEGSYTDFLNVENVAYSGAMEGMAGGRLLTFRLTTPYTYTGSNLVMQISLGSAGSAYPHATFLGVDPDQPTAAYTTMGYSVYGSNFLPKTTFTYGEQAQYEASVSASELAFPVTLAGNTAQGRITVTNSGVQPLDISMTAPAAPFSATLPAATIAPGASVEIPVTFSPTAPGDFTGQLTLDLGQAGTFGIQLAGSGMVAPDGYTAAFNLPAKTLPEGWTGWVVTDIYDYDIYEYKFEEAKASTEYFVSSTTDGTMGIGIDDSNPIRNYPRQHSVYMISPAVQGAVMLSVAKIESYGGYGVSVFKATQLADGTWNIGTEPLDFTWASTDATWNLMIGSVSEPTALAIRLSSAAISTFAAETAAGDVGQEYAATVTPEAIDFGQIVVGRNESRQIQVLNTGRKPFDLTVTGAGDDGVVTATVSSATVAAGATATVDVTVTPAAAGDIARQLTVDMGQAGTAVVELSATAVGAQIGAEFTVGGVTYVVLSDNEAGVSAVSSELTECEIPATVENADGIIFDVVSVEREAFYFSNVARVTLPESVRSIGYGAFRQSPLAEINLPAGLTLIGDYAFRYTQLASVVIPDGVTVLGSSVFGLCENLEHVTLPANLTEIGSGAFYKTALTSVEIPNSCLTIGMEAFEECTSLTHVTLPEGLTEIAPMLFLGCTSLTDVAIPSTVTKINAGAFEECAFTTLAIPASVASIASSSFNGTPVRTITVEEGNTAFKVVDDILYDADGSFLYLCPRTGMGDEITVADGTRGIIGGAFYECDMKKVVLPESMLGIDEYAFCLSTLEEINLPDNIFLMGTQALAGTLLTDVVLPASLEEISDAMLASCQLMTSVTIPASVTLVGNRAFLGCTALTEIIAQGETPAEFDAWDGFTDPFRDVDCSKITVYCPDGEAPLAAYKASEWADFFANIKNISERPGSAITDVTASGISVSGGNTVAVTLGDAVADIEVSSVAGQLLRRVEGATGTISLEGLPSGVCIVTVTVADGRRATFKAVVR